eukprot:3999040-Pyramimonas_sp.AAC.1
MSCRQTALRGVSFGKYLIKDVVELLRRELPNLQKFVTLSPIPLFGKWLEERLSAPLHWCEYSTV